MTGGSAGRAESLRALEREVGVLVRRVRRVIGERARAVHPDLQAGSYLILSTVSTSGPLRASTLAETLDIDKGAISRQVKHLLDLGLLQCSKDPADGRAMLLSLTDDAVARMDDVVAHRQKLLDERLGDWSPQELEELVRQLGRYNAALERY